MIYLEFISRAIKRALMFNGAFFLLMGILLRFGDVNTKPYEVTAEIVKESINIFFFMTLFLFLVSFGVFLLMDLFGLFVKGPSHPKLVKRGDSVWISKN